MLLIEQLSPAAFTLFLSAYFCLALLHIAVLAFMRFRMKRFSIKSVALIISMLVVVTLCVILTQGRNALISGIKPDVPLFMKLPAAAGVIYFAVVAVILCIVLLREIYLQKRTITRCSIKEGIDCLPTGLCFSRENGTVLLANHNMNMICHKITGMELQNAEDFWSVLTGDSELTGIRRINSGKSPVLCLQDNTIWSFQRTEIIAEGISVVQITAADITELHSMTEKLRRQNQELEQMNARLRKYGENVEELTRKKEWLDTKVRIHGEFGQALLNTRRYLANPKPEYSGQLLKQWTRNIAVIRQSTAPENRSTLAELYEAAESAGITINLDGVIPQQRRAVSLLLTVAAEALTNAVKHAGADLLTIRITEQDNEYIAEFTNNGLQPTEAVSEGGGLGTLRIQLENAGGGLNISAENGYRLTVFIPKKGGDE